MQLPESGRLSREDIVAVHVAARTLVLSGGPVSFAGKDIALCFPDCPSDGLSFDAASGLYKKDVLVRELQLSKSGNRCAEASIPHGQFKDLVTRRYEMLKGEKVFGFMPWYVVSAAYTEFEGTCVNWADEVAGRMLEALLAFKHGGKKLKFEVEIFKHLSRLQMFKLHNSANVNAEQLVTPGEEQVVQEPELGMDFGDRETPSGPGPEPEPEPVVESNRVEAGQQEEVLQLDELLPEQDVLQEWEGLRVEGQSLGKAVLQEQDLVLEREGWQNCDGSFGGELLGQGGEELTKPSVAAYSGPTMVWEQADQGVTLPLQNGGVEDRGVEVVKDCAIQEHLTNAVNDDEVAAQVHLCSPYLPLAGPPTYVEAVDAEVLQFDTAEQERQRSGDCMRTVSTSDEVTMQSSIDLQGQDLNTQAADLGGVRCSVAGNSCNGAAQRPAVGRHVRERVQTRSKSGVTRYVEDPSRTKQDQCKQFETATQKRTHQEILSKPDKLKSTLIDLHTTIRATEESLRKARKEEAVIGLRHSQLSVKLEEVDSEGKVLREQFLQARDVASNFMAERDKTLAHKIKEMQASQAMNLVKVAEMHVKRRKMEEENVALDERDCNNKAQIWELEKALYDQGHRLDAIWKHWESQNGRFEELKAEETKIEKRLLLSSQNLANLQDESSKLSLDLKKQNVIVAELESRHFQLTASRELAESELHCDNDSLDLPQSPDSDHSERHGGHSKRRSLDVERELKRRNQDTEREMANVWRRPKDEASVWTKRPDRGSMTVV